MKDEELDAILGQMAEEVPPVPADFRGRWMNAVRAEARETAPAAEDKTPKTVFLVRRTRILGVAAAFVFLIGGTLLWRNTKQTLTAAGVAGKQEAAVMFAAEENAAGSAAEEPAVMAAGVMDETEESAPEAADAYAGITELFSSMKAAGSVMNSAASSDMAAGAVMEEEADYAIYEAAAVEEAEPVPEPAAMPTAEPTAAPTAVPTAEPEKPGFLQETGAFFTDMGDFLLAALPYLLVLAVPAAAALAVRRKKARK